MSVDHPRSTSLLVLATLSMSLNDCRIVGDIFKAGVWVGVIAVGLVIALLFGLVRLFGGSR
jgi:hypothetical protein